MTATNEGNTTAITALVNNIKLTTTDERFFCTGSIVKTTADNNMIAGNQIRKTGYDTAIETCIINLIFTTCSNKGIFAHGLIFYTCTNKGILTRGSIIDTCNNSRILTGSGIG